MSFKKAIVLCTKDGSLFLEKQLISLFQQTDSKFDLYINDDGSTDKTFEILKSFKKMHKSAKINITTHKFGCSNKNFIETLKNVPDIYDYYFFCDQDDIWMRDKIKNSTLALSDYKDIPALFCGRTTLIDTNDKKIGQSPLFSKKPTLNNALVQSISGGNTMCFNQETKKLLNQVDSTMIPAHDWLTYIIVTAHNGKVIYTSNSQVLYRWHNKNQIGPNQSVMARLKRLNLLFQGDFRNWVKSNNEIRSKYKLPDNSSNLIELFIKKIHNGNLFERIIYFFKLNIYRQQTISNFMLFLAVVIKKI